MKDVFISYSHVNKIVAREFSAGLEELGIEYFLDEKEITWGTPLTKSVEDALDQCCAVVVIVSHASLKSAWVPYEVGHAIGANSMGTNKIILPILTDPTLNLPGYLVDLAWVSDVEKALEFFSSRTWRDHCRESRKARVSDLTALRNQVADLNKWLELYMPGMREPEDL